MKQQRVDQIVGSIHLLYSSRFFLLAREKMVSICSCNCARKVGTAGSVVSSCVSYHVLLYHVILYCVDICYNVSFYIVLSHVLLCRVMLYCCVELCYIVLSHVKLCRIMLCCVESC